MNKEIPRLVQEGLLTPSLERILKEFYCSYMQETSFSCEPESANFLFKTLVDLVITQVNDPYPFEIFHQAIREPFDYYQFGLDFIRPLIDFSSSEVLGLRYIQQLRHQLAQGENVIFLANHQTEPDPQIISLLLEEIDPHLSQQMIFVAGHRVITDPIAIPCSLGRNLLCIFSKKHIAHPPELKADKILHNQRTLKKMVGLLKEGGQCIYVAPSGGRDRKNGEEVEIAPFDSQSLELFWLMAQQAGTPTHFYPLSLKTYDLMPPPRHIEKEIGERRTTHYTPVFMAVGEEFDMENFPGSEGLDKKAKRDKRALTVWQHVFKNYSLFN